MTRDSVKPENDGTARIYFVCLAVCAILMFLGGFGRRHLWNPDEPRVAGIGAEMAQTGDLIVPRVNGEPFLEKPPLYFWLLSATFRFLGEGTYTARLPSALAAIGGILVVFVFARRTGSSARGAFVAGFILATAAEYWYLGNRCLTDMLLTFFITCTMVSFYLAIRSSSKVGLWDVAFVVSLAGAVMTKALVGLAVPFSALFVWLLVERDFSLRAWSLLLIGFVLCLIPAAIWVWLLYNDLGWDAAYDVVWTNNFGRFTGSRDSHVRPFYYYAENMPAQFLPWTLLLPVAAIYWFRHTRERQEDRSFRFLLTWLIVPFLLLSMSSGKRGIYALPLYPAAALLVGRGVDAVLEGRQPPTRWFMIPAAFLAGAIALISLAFLGICIYFKQSFLVWPLVALPGLLLGVAACRGFARKNLAEGFKMLVAGCVLIYVTADLAVLPIFNRYKSHEPLFNYCGELMSEGTEIVLYQPKETLRGGAFFYLGKTVRVFESKEDVLNYLSSAKAAVAIAEREDVRKRDNLRILRDFEIGHRKMVVVAAALQKVPLV